MAYEKPIPVQASSFADSARNTPKCTTVDVCSCEADIIGHVGMDDATRRPV
jgi:hypothetical protein